MIYLRKLLRKIQHAVWRKIKFDRDYYAYRRQGYTRKAAIFWAEMTL